MVGPVFHRQSTGGSRGKRAIACLLGASIAVAAMLPIVGRWLTNPIDQRVVDLDVYRTAGIAVLRGASVYDFLTEPPQLLPFTYPPFAALLATPMALLSWPAAQIVMTLLIFVVLVLVVGYAFRPLIARAGDWSPLAWGVLVALMAYPLPVYDQFRFGQVDLFLVLLCVADCATPRTRWPRGVLIGFATAVKLVPGVFLIYLLITRRREAATNALLTAAGATLVSFALLPEDSLDFWWPFHSWHSQGALFDGDRVGSNFGTANQAFRGFLLRMYWPDAVTALVWLIAVAVLAYLGFRFARRASLLADSGRLGPADTWSAEIAGVAITGLLAVLLSPVAWIHHLAWIVLVVGALAGAGTDRRRVAAAAGAWLFYVLTIPWWGTSHIQPWKSVPEKVLGRIMQSSYALGAVALLFVLGVWLVKRMWRETPADIEDVSQDAAEVGTLAP
ncbi:glycosyltransferase 87 family protein [Actinocorallia longicatena]|uniref:Glycosyltransferase 87 family protein n=1 Tax=Actinocorallia longicatena TaxID=111803 RepID=A0ABP6QBT1_9ACTN